MSPSPLNDYCRWCTNYLNQLCAGTGGRGRMSCFEAVENAPGSVCPETGDPIAPEAMADVTHRILSPVAPGARPDPKRPAVASCCPEGPAPSPSPGPNPAYAETDAQRPASPPTPSSDRVEAAHAATGTSHRPVAARGGVFECQPGTGSEGASNPAGLLRAFSNYPAAKMHYEWAKGRLEAVGGCGSKDTCDLIGVSSHHGNGILTLL